MTPSSPITTLTPQKPFLKKLKQCTRSRNKKNNVTKDLQLPATSRHKMSLPRHKYLWLSERAEVYGGVSVYADVILVWPSPFRDDTWHHVIVVFPSVIHRMW